MASTADTGTESAIEKMSQYFPTNRSHKLSASDIQQIADLLSHPTSQWRNSWSQVPRLYCVLRLIGLESTIERLISEGITSDFWFPFSTRTLPSCMSPGEKDKFLAAQSMVINDDILVEKDAQSGKECKHVHFNSENETPFIQVARLGSGGFGIVDEVKSTVSHRTYARKTTPRSWVFLKSRREMQAFQRERKAMAKLNHRHTIEFIGSYTTPRSLCMLISPVAEMNLEEFLRKSPDVYPGRDLLLREFFGCLSRGFRYLHEETKIRHRDVKPANILIHEGIVKIADFGLSLDWTGGHTTTTAGTSPGWSPRYCAPEVAESKPRSSSSDIWSLGCVFLEIVTVLKGKTVRGLVDFIKEYGADDFGGGNTAYHSNSRAITVWTQQLISISQEDNEPIDWVNKMLDHVKANRPSAAKLVEYTCHEGKAHGWSYCGTCCADGTDDEGDTEDMGSWSMVESTATFTKHAVSRSVQAGV